MIVFTSCLDTMPVPMREYRYFHRESGNRKRVHVRPHAGVSRFSKQRLTQQFCTRAKLLRFKGKSQLNATVKKKKKRKKECVDVCNSRFSIVPRIKWI